MLDAFNHYLEERASEGGGTVLDDSNGAETARL